MAATPAFAIAWLVTLTMLTMSQLECLIVDSPPEPGHRFSGVSYRGTKWNLNHLDAFTFKIDLGLGEDVTVLVLFSCHCFTRSFRWDARATHLIPADEIYDDGKERRVLDPQRYELSRRYLRDVVVQIAISAHYDRQRETTELRYARTAERRRHDIPLCRFLRSGTRPEPQATHRAAHPVGLRAGQRADEASGKGR